METPTKKIITPVLKMEVEIREWITGREAEEIEAVLYAGVDVKPNMATRGVDFGKFNPEIIDKQTHKLIEKFVVAISGDKSEVLKKILDLPEADYKFILAEINETRNPAKKKDEAGQAKQ